jgi:predicted nucleic acid-binding protein
MVDDQYTWRDPDCHSTGISFIITQLEELCRMARIKVYFDNCAYNRPFDDQRQIKIALETEAKKHIQQLIIEKEIDLVYSYINRLENDDNPFTTRKNLIDSFFVNAVFYIDAGHAEAIEERAVVIMQTGIKSRDALHIACAIESGCDYFITTDKPLLRHKLNGIVICNPIWFLDYLEEI